MRASVDVFALAKIDGSWKIVNKTFAHPGGEVCRPADPGRIFKRPSRRSATPATRYGGWRLLFDELLGVLDTEVVTGADREDHD
jgi:Putative lumazine-binding